MDKEQILKQVAQKYKLGDTLVTGHASLYWKEAMEEYAALQSSEKEKEIQRLKGIIKEVLMALGVTNL